MTDKIEILYVSGMCSKERIELIHKCSGRNPGYAAQKFNRLIAEGLAANGCKVATLSAPPVGVSMKHKFFNWHAEECNGVMYHYIPFVNMPIIRQVCLFVYTFFFILFWGMQKRKERIVVSDMLAVSINIAMTFACMLNGLKRVGILTDMPGLLVGEDGKKSLIHIIKRVSEWVQKRYMTSFSSYIFLTEAMNPIVNIHNRPYIVMEGLVAQININQSTPAKEKSVVYAGGLFEKYGVNMLVEAFLQVAPADFRLHLYGNGTSGTWIKAKAIEDSRIQYHGVVPNDEVIAMERKAILLVNPRPSTEEFTKYSFPSKNMEYMLSGTALLTTKLPGMPPEYYPYVFLVEEETVSGFANIISGLLSMPVSALEEKGQSAQMWVSKHKNNIAQTRRIIALIQRA